MIALRTFYSHLVVSSLLFIAVVGEVKHDCNLACYFVQTNDFDSVVDLLKNNKELAYIANKDGWTPLHEAAEAENILMMTLFLENGADALAKNIDSKTPRDILLLSRPEGPSVKSFDFAESILRDAEEGKGMHGDFIEKKTLRQSFKIVSKFPKLARRLVQFGLKETLQELFYIDESIIHQLDDFGWTLLHDAARFGNVDILSFLMDAGANIHQRTSAGETVLRIANEWKTVDSEIHNALVLTLSTHASAGVGTIKRRMKSHAR